jgi:hypothetical protein
VQFSQLGGSSKYKILFMEIEDSIEDVEAIKSGKNEYNII